MTAKGFNFIIVVLTWCICTSLALPFQHINARGYDNEDAFYNPPLDYEQQHPGSILKFREMPKDSMKAFDRISNDFVQAYQFLYKTTDNLNQSTSTVTTLLVPKNDPDPSKLVSYQVAEDSAFTKCAPSYTLQNSSEQINTANEVILMGVFLQKGYYINVPDYQGPKSSFCAGYMSGYGVLDSIRAVLSSSQMTGLQPDASVGLMGYSGGAYASGWAAQLQSTYANDVKIAGASMGGTLTNPVATIDTLNEGPYMGLIPTGMMALTRVYDDLKEYFDKTIVPDKKDDLEQVFEQCLLESFEQFANQSIHDYFQDPNYLDNPAVKEAFGENAMGNVGSPIDIPMYMYHTIHDEMVPFNATYQMAKKWCQSGSTIMFAIENSTRHGDLAMLNSHNAVSFLVDRLDGIPLDKGCSDENIYLPYLVPEAEPIIGSSIYNIINESFSQQ